MKFTINLPESLSALCEAFISQDLEYIHYFWPGHMSRYREKVNRIHCMSFKRFLKFDEKTIQKGFGIMLALMAVFCYGYFTHSKKIFPYQIIHEANKGFKQVNQRRRWFYIETDQVDSTKMSSDYYSKKLTLITLVDKYNKLAVKVIDMHGQVVHKWVINWFDLWPDASHVPEESVPKGPPGTYIHGALLLDNGDLVFNFEYLGLLRLNLCGEVMWKLPVITHHSVHKDEENNLWVSGQRIHRDFGAKVRHRPFYSEELVLKISPDGEILKDISVQEILDLNGLNGLLHMSILMGAEKNTRGDILHNNDVETFPIDVPPGYFNPGDIMISLRNINTVLVFQEKDLKVKALSVGEVVKQHDPDFIDGNTISIFDNNMVESTDVNPQSRIVIKSFGDNEEFNTYYSGTEEQPFYTRILGKHQWLENGNLLVTSPHQAMAFEIDSSKNRVWEYTNLLGNGYRGLMAETQRLPGHFTEQFFTNGFNKCADGVN